jgi:hypothetical protein
MPTRTGVRKMNEVSTCKVCSYDFYDEDMIEDIQGTKYCLLDSGFICVVCGIFGHECETGETK